MDDVKKMLEQVAAGTMSVEEAVLELKKEPFSAAGFDDLGFAKLDTHRKIRSGFPEVVFCAGKADAHLLAIFGRLYEEEGEVLGTRASREQYELIRSKYAQVQYDETSRILKIEHEGKAKAGCIAVCTAGTADIPVAEEAAQVADYFGACEARV